MEKHICSNETLSALDSQLASVYLTAKSAASSDLPTDFLEAQRNWIKRRNLCLDYPCVFEAYKGRIAELSQRAGAKIADGVLPRAETTAAKTVAKELAQFREVPTDSYFVGGIEFNTDASELVASPLDAPDDVHIWRWRDQPKLSNRTLWPTSCPYARMNECATTRNLLAASADGALWAFARVPLGAEGPHTEIRVFNAQTGVELHKFDESHGNDGAVAIAFSPDGKFFFRAVWRGTGRKSELLVYRTDTWAQVQGLLTRPFTPRALAISPDGRRAAVAGARWTPKPHPEILVVDLGSGMVTRTIDHPFPDEKDVSSLAWSCDGASLLAGTLVYRDAFEPDVVRMYDPNTGAQVGAESAEAADVTTIRCSPDSRYLVEAGINGGVRIWDSQHTTLLQTIEIKKGPGVSAFFGISRDSGYLAIADLDRISVWQFQ